MRKRQEKEKQTDFIADMQGKEQHEHAGGRVAAMMSGPVVMDVFEECWVEDLDLVRNINTEERNITNCLLAVHFIKDQAPPPNTYAKFLAVQETAAKWNLTLPQGLNCFTRFKALLTTVIVNLPWTSSPI